MPAVTQFLDQLDPRLRTALLALLTFVVLFAWRKLHPSSFERLPRQVQEFPALFVGVVLALLAAHVDGLASQISGDAGAGLLSGVMAIGLHRFLKNTPWIPYGGPGAATNKPEATSTAAKALFIAAVLAFVPACGGASPNPLPMLTILDAARVQTESVLAWIREHLPGEDDSLASKYAAAERAYRERDYGYALVVGRELLVLLAQNYGETAPAAVVADQVTGAAAAEAIQNGMSALSKPSSAPPAKPISEPAKPAEVPQS